MTVGHGEDAAELDRDGVFGGTEFLARRHGASDLAGRDVVHDLGILEALADFLSCTVDEDRLSEWRVEAPLHLVNAIAGHRRHSAVVVMGLQKGSQKTSSRTVGVCPNREGFLTAPWMRLAVATCKKMEVFMMSPVEVCSRAKGCVREKFRIQK